MYGRQGPNLHQQNAIRATDKQVDPCKAHMQAVQEKASSNAHARAPARREGEEGGLGKGCIASHLQMGHSGLRADSHWSMHSRWKRCLQGSTRSFSPSLHARGTFLAPPIQW